MTQINADRHGLKMQGLEKPAHSSGSMCMGGCAIFHGDAQW